MLGNAQRSLRNVVGRRIDGPVEVLERQAGGGAVLTGPAMVSASIILPHGHRLLGDSLVGSYRWLGQVHVAALAEFAVLAYALPPHAVGLANAMIAARTVRWACFGGLSPWEVVDAGYRKLVGLAQRRQRSGVLLVAGTLVGATDWRLLCEVMGHPEDEAVLRRRTASCDELAGCSMEPASYAAVLTRLIGESLACAVRSGGSSSG